MICRLSVWASLHTELDGLCFFVSYNGTYIMTVNTDYVAIDFTSFKQVLFLFKNFSDDGKSPLIILGIPEWSALPAMNPVPLTDEFFKKPDHTALVNSYCWSLPLYFLAVGQIELRHILVFVTWTLYTKLSTMLADMPVVHSKLSQRSFIFVGKCKWHRLCTR